MFSISPILITMVSTVTISNYDLQTAVVRSLSMCILFYPRNICIATHNHFPAFDFTGTLNYKELQAALSEVMMTEVTFELVQIVCAEFDKDRNGVIDVSEFAMMIVRTTYAFLVLTD